VPHLAKLLTDGGRAVFSGILELEKESVGLELDRAGFAAIDALRLGEWLALVVGLGK
jgi:ribosomal protein L11 methylase PrmA